MTALTGFRVLELAAGVAGEYCGKLLADFGADVIKLEHPDGGSATRHLGPFAKRGSDCRDGLERSGLFAYLNTNKRSVVLDVLDAPEDCRLEKLLQNVDVVIDDHPAGWLREAGLDPDTYQEKYPGLVVCSITSFGQHPPEDRLHAEDLTVFHSSGWGYHTPGVDDPQQPPLKGVGRFLPSYEAGLEAALCVVASLYAREESALGRFIDISKLQVLASRADYVLAQMVAGDMPVGPERTAYNLGGPAGIFACRDGYAYIWMSAPTHWAALRKLLDNPQWMASFPDNWLEKECTPERVAQCRHYLTEWLKTQHKHAVAASAQRLGLTLVAVNNASDLQSCEQYQFRRFFQKVEHPVQGAVLYPTVPYQLSETPARIVTPAPLLGQHTQSALAALSTDRSVTARAARTTLQRGGPLQGVRVVELTKVWAGPYVGKLLAYLGAEVIRVESEDSLDVTRSYGVSDINHAPGFQSVNPEKLSVTVNMKTAEGVGIIRDLLKKSDIVVENLRPGAVKRLGLGYEDVRKGKPDIVYVSMGMYGTEGPLSYQTGYAPCFAALGGLSSLVGYAGAAPSGMNIRYADSTFGAAAVFGALVALLHRRRSGVGQFVDVSAVECMSSMIGDALMDFALNGTIAAADGNRHADMAPHSVYPCSNGEWISIAVSSDAQWAALAQAMGQPDLAAHASFASHSARKAHEERLDGLLAAWTARQDAATLAQQLQQRGVCASKSQSSLDLVADALLWSRGFYQQVTDSQGESKTTLGPAWKMSGAAAISRAAPRLGEHNAYVLGELLGLSAEEQRTLAAAGVAR
jgi:crotonobetainyl-CoA:carnitine CoA-transferase CaiB-like acyl-CoA transferase